MALKKQVLKSKPVCKVTFKITAEEAQNADAASVVGEFNDWDASAAPMQRLKNGDFKLTLDLTSGADYQFRYLLNGETWINDPEADRYQFSPVGNCDNSVVSC